MLAKLLIPLLLLALLLGAAAARADSAASAAPPVALEEAEFEVEEEGEEESPEEECEEATEEFEEGEISGEELDEGCERQRKRYEPGRGGILPEICVVRSFDSSAVADAGKGTVDLTIHYTTFEPTMATIEYGPHGMRLDTVRRHLGARGTIHLRQRASDAQMKRLKGGRKLPVQIEVPATPPSCQRYYSASTALQLR